MTESEITESEEELDLNTLSDEELVEQMHDDLYDGLKEEIEAVSYTHLTLPTSDLV